MLCLCVDVSTQAQCYSRNAGAMVDTLLLLNLAKKPQY